MFYSSWTHHRQWPIALFKGKPKPGTLGQDSLFGRSDGCVDQFLTLFGIAATDGFNDRRIFVNGGDGLGKRRFVRMGNRHALFFARGFEFLIGLERKLAFKIASLGGRIGDNCLLFGGQRLSGHLADQQHGQRVEMAGHGEVLLNFEKP